MLAHRLRRWANIEPTLYERLVFAGNYQHSAERRDVPVVECDLNPPARVKVAQMVDKRSPRSAYPSGKFGDTKLPVLSVPVDLPRISSFFSVIKHSVVEEMRNSGFNETGLCP